MTTQAYLVAQSEPPTIWCPPWCEFGETHLPELNEWEGKAVHLGFWPTPGTVTIGLGRALLCDGSLDLDDNGVEETGACIAVHIDGHAYSLDEAEQVAAVLAEVITAAKAEEARTR